MKKQVIALVALAGIAAGSTLAFAAAGSSGGGIVGSKHDMNVFLKNNGAAGSGDLDQRVCAYCHTPHHAADPTQSSTYTKNDGTDVVYTTYLPLWSRSIPAGPYDEYRTATFNPAADKFYDPLAGPSRLCMSCHDGNIAVDTYYGKTGLASTPKGDDAINYFGSGSFAVGLNFGLSNDHPVGFVYEDMANDSTNFEIKASGSTFIGGTKTIESVLATVPGVTGKIMTCASCHDVHNGPAVLNKNPASGRGYFLLAEQKDSAICLSCHDKNK